MDQIPLRQNLDPAYGTLDITVTVDQFVPIASRISSHVTVGAATGAAARNSPSDLSG